MKFNPLALLKKISRLTRQERRILTFGIILLVAGIGYPILIMPKAKIYRTYTKEMRTKTQALRMTRQTLTDYQQWQETRQKGISKEILFFAEERLGFLGDLARFAQNSGTRLMGIRPSAVENVNEPKLIALPAVKDLRLFFVNISLEGKYAQILALLTKFEEYPKLIDLENLEVKLARAGYPYLEVNLTLKMFIGP